MVKNVNPAPTVGQTRCAGISIVISHVLLGACTALYSIDYNVYDVNSPKDIIEMHNKISTKEHRTEIEIGVTLLWIAFPFFLCGIYGWTKYFRYIFFNTNMELLVYILEKAYLIWVLILCIVFPSLALVSVSFDWNYGITYENVTINNIPAGYYNQLYAIIYQLELIDNVCIAEACVVISLFTLGKYISFRALNGDRKFKYYFEALNFCKNKANMWIKFVNIISILFMIIFFIIFTMVMFEFGEYGLFAPDSRLKFILGFVLVFKILFALEFGFLWSKPAIINKIKILFADVNDDINAGSLIGKNDDCDVVLQQTHTNIDDSP